MNRLGRGPHDFGDASPPVPYPLTCAVCGRRLPSNTDPKPLCPGDPSERSRMKRTPLERGSGLERRTRLNRVSERREQKRPDLGTPLQAYVEGLSCLLLYHPGHRCRGDVVAHHVVHKAHAGDWLERGGERRGNLIPACHKLHAEIHDDGKDTVTQRYGLESLAAEAERVGERYEESKASA